MGFTKLSNPKPGKTIVPPDGVSVSCRTMNRTKPPKNGVLPPPCRFAQVTIAAGIARRAGFGGVAKADVVIGDGLERRRCGISASATGAFKLRKLTNGNYQVTIPERAAAGLLSFDAPPFVAVADLVPVAQGAPPCVMFDLSAEIRAA